MVCLVWIEMHRSKARNFGKGIDQSSMFMNIMTLAKVTKSYSLDWASYAADYIFSFHSKIYDASLILWTVRKTLQSSWNFYAFSI